jgi:acetyltransferase-like isoleucine patch superfamily enzyme
MKFLTMKFYIKIVLRIVRYIPFSNIRVRLLRHAGITIGEDCRLFSADWGSEPYLIRLGDHVVVSNNVRFLTHDGAVWVFRPDDPDLDVFGTIKIGNNVCIGINVILLPNTEIGDNCIVGAGSVVKGKIPSNSVVFGNPAKVVMPLEMQKRLIAMSKFRFHSKGMSFREKKRMLKKQ